MGFEYIGKCQRCGVPAGYLDGELTHTFAGILYKKTLKDCSGPIFEKEASQ